MGALGVFGVWLGVGEDFAGIGMNAWRNKCNARKWDWD
jgi:hypothetical protein